ncbi:hypothetical protein D3C86_2169200 [compost metagenome]
MKLTSDTAAETRKGSCRLRCPSIPPSAGPMMKPIPKAAPSIPKFWARFSGLLTSAM